jgi:hypothetical protein
MLTSLLMLIHSSIRDDDRAGADECRHRAGPMGLVVLGTGERCRLASLASTKHPHAAHISPSHKDMQFAHALAGDSGLMHAAPDSYPTHIPA